MPENIVQRLWRKMMHPNRVGIRKRFRGLINADLPQPPRGQAGSVNFTKQELVIRDEEAFVSFIGRLPKTLPLSVPPTKPNPDVLLRHPKIDFEKHMVLVIVTHAPSRFVDLDVIAVKVDGKAMKVLCRYYAPGRFGPEIVRQGNYCAVVANRFDGDVVSTQSPD